jgi:hypothetical protein
VLNETPQGDILKEDSMTKKQIICGMCGGLLLALLASGPVQAQADPDEGRLDATEKALEKEGAAKGQGQTQLLAKQFNVAPSLVDDLRKKTGWGGVTIQLAMAQHLAQSDPVKYPSLPDALTKIEELRAEKMGWGKIGKELGFKLGPVVSAAEQTRHELARDLRAERPQKIDKADRPDKVDKPERAERPERPQRPERAHVK